MVKVKDQGQGRGQDIGLVKGQGEGQVTVKVKATVREVIVKDRGQYEVQYISEPRSSSNVRYDRFLYLISPSSLTTLYVNSSCL